METQIFKKTRLITGVDVHSSLLSVIERRTSSSPSSSAVKQDDLIARMLYEDDPFAIALASFSSIDRSSSNSSRVKVNDNIVEALSDVNNQFIGHYSLTGWRRIRSRLVDLAGDSQATRQQNSSPFEWRRVRYKVRQRLLLSLFVILSSV